MTLSERKRAEILHGKRICERAESVWGWATEAGKLRAERRAELLYRLGQLSCARTILEIGCGTGEFTRRLVAQGASGLIAIDLSLDLIRKAKESAGNFSGTHFIVADAEHLPFKDGAVERVIGVSILHHLDRDTAINETARVLKKEGRIAFSEPNMLNPQVFLMKNILFIKSAAGDVENETALLKPAIEKELASAGFTDTVVTPFDFLHPYTPKHLIAWIRRIGEAIEGVPILKEISGSLFITAKIHKK